MIDSTKPRLADVARIAHEVNRAYCQAIGDNSLLPWGDSPDWQKRTVMKGIWFHLDNPEADANASHESWLNEKLDEGWEYGEKKDPEKKQHPCMVPFEKLPLEHQIKDHLFRAVVHAAAPEGLACPKPQRF